MGSLLTGQLFKAIGGRWTFRVYSLTALLMLPLCIVLDYYWPMSMTHEDSNKMGHNVEIEVQKNIGKYHIYNILYIAFFNSLSALLMLSLCILLDYY